MIGSSSRWRLAAAVSPLAMMAASPALAAKTPNPTARTVAGSAAVLQAAAQPVSTTADTPPAASKEEIVVTGFRAALQSATAKKKKSDQVVESVSAEDIGKLPDNSIGESIARLPGVTSQRVNGRASGIAIRGFGPDFSTTTLNGREQTSTNDARGVEFDQYPSEIVSRVDIYKTPTASLIGQGLVGTIDIRTARPLDYSKPVLAIGARASYDDLGRLVANTPKYGRRVYGTFIDKFADDRVGVALSASYLDEPYENQQFNAWGYAGSGTAASPYVIGGSKSFVTSTELKRFGLNGTVQAKVNDSIVLTADGFYSHFNDTQFLKGIELPLGFGSFFNTTGPVNTTVVNGFTTSGTFPTVYGVVRNDIFERRARLYSGGLNALWDPHNGWGGFLDFGYSRTNRNELSLESYSGTGYGNNAADPSDAIGFTSGLGGTSFTHRLNYSDPNLIRLTDPLGWGGSTVQAGYYNNRIVKDDLKQYRGELHRDLGSFFNVLRVGFNYTDRNKSLTPDESFVTLPNGATSAPIPANYLQRPTDLGYLGLGPIVSYDARRLINAGILTLKPNTSQDIPAKAYDIKERLATPYVQADIKAAIGTAELTGNVGVQAMHTDQSSSGLAFANGVGFTRVAGARYWDVLPSLNLALRFPNDFIVRLGAAREIQRPRLDDMREALSYGVNTNASNCPNNASSCINGGGGNPALRPYRANAADLTFEKYFALKGYASLQLFYKQINTFIIGGRKLFDYSGLPRPTGVLPGTSTTGYLDSPVNVSGGHVYGGELAATLPFGIFSPAVDGFGFTGGVGYTKSKVPDQNGRQIAIPGYSKWVANGTLFYEKYGFNARGSVRYRSTFLGDFTGFGGSPTRRTALKETIFDAQVGYDFPVTSALAGLSVYLQGQNLTNERFESVAVPTVPLSVLDHQTYGRRYLLGATYKFFQRAAPVVAPVVGLPPPPVAVQTCPDGTVVAVTGTCPVPPAPPPPPPPPPATKGQRG